METALLDTDSVDARTPIELVIGAVEAAFRADAQGNVIMPPKSYVDLPQYNGDFRAMPAYLDVGEWDAAGLKWVNVHPDNPTNHDLPTVMATMIYSDPASGFPLALMDGTVLTQKRTGAAAAVATEYLAVDDARTMGIVGAGAQADTQLEAVAMVRDIDSVIIADRNEQKQADFVERFRDRFEVHAGSITDAAKCDVLSTVTPTAEPIVNRGDVGATTHINAIGADAPGKHELADAILKDAKLVIDNYEQCTHSGEINVPWSAGLLTDQDLHGELGEIVVGEKPGRTPTDGITVFDSTGLAIQDVAAAHVAYEQPTTNDDKTTVRLLNV